MKKAALLIGTIVTAVALPVSAVHDSVDQDETAVVILKRPGLEKVLLGGFDASLGIRTQLQQRGARVVSG